MSLNKKSKEGVYNALLSQRNLLLAQREKEKQHVKRLLKEHRKNKLIGK